MCSILSLSCSGSRRHSPQRFVVVFRLQLDLTFALSSILETGAEGESSTKPGLSMGEDASDSSLAIREDITDIPHQKPSQPSVPEMAIGGPSTRSLGTEHIERHPPDVIVVEHIIVGHTPSSDVEVPTPRSPTPTVLNDFLPISMLLPSDSVITLSEYASFSLGSHSQVLAPAAAGLSRSWESSAAVEGEERAKIALCQEKGMGNDEPHDDVAVTSDAPIRLLPTQPIVDVAITGVPRENSRSSLDMGKYPSCPQQYDIV